MNDELDEFRLMWIIQKKRIKIGRFANGAPGECTVN